MNKKSTILILVFIILFIVLNCAKHEEIQISTNSDEALNLFLEGREDFELIEFKNAADLLDKAIELDPNFAMANLYRYFTGIGDYTKYFDKAYQSIDNVSEGEKYYLLATKANIDNDDVMFKEHMSKLTELFPSDKRVHAQWANYYYGLGENEKAIKYYNKVLSLDKRYAPVYNNLGYIYMDQKNYDEAEKVFEKQIELIPNRANPYDSYAELLSTIGKYDESTEQYQKAYEKDNSFLMAFEGIGDNYVLKGDFEKSREYYQKRFDKGTHISAKLVALYDIANSYIYEGKIDKAIESFNKYQDIAQKGDRAVSEVYSYIYIGTVYTNTGDNAQGLASFQKALKLSKEVNLPKSIKDNLIVTSKSNECSGLIMSDYIAEAKVKIDELQELTKDRNSISDEKTLNWLQGLLEWKSQNYNKALDLLYAAYPENVLNKYYVAKCYKALGEKEKADKKFAELKDWKTIGLQQAIVSYLIR